MRDGAEADESALRRHCRERVARYKVPKSIEFVSALPMTPVGKVAKNVLRRKYWEPAGRRIG